MEKIKIVVTDVESIINIDPVVVAVRQVCLRAIQKTKEVAKDA